jgi:hypothetical protein
MTSTAARTVANAVLVSAGFGAAYVVLRSPKLRRLAIGALRIYLGASVPFVMSETRRAWVESGRVA